MDLEGPDEDTGIEKTGGAVGSLKSGGIDGGTFNGLGWLDRADIGASLNLGLASPLIGDKVISCLKMDRPSKDLMENYEP